MLACGKLFCQIEINDKWFPKVWTLSNQTNHHHKLTSPTNNKFDNCELELSFNERVRFLDCMEKEIGKEKMKNFEKNDYKDEGKS